MQMNRAKVSVVVPVYNVEKYLDRCMQTILNQTLKDIEIILVDDESPDNCPAMCDAYANSDQRVKVVHKKNGGLGFARNSGLEVATGEYVAFCDSDDWVELDTYEVLYSLAKERNLDAVYTEFNVKYHPGFHVILHDERIYQNREEIERLRLDIVGAEPEYDSDVKFQVSACKAIYKLDLLKGCGVQFHSERELISEDYAFNLDFLLVAQRVMTTPLQKYYYWLNPNSLSHGYRPNLWKRLSHFYDHLGARVGEFSNSEEFFLRFHRQVLQGLRSSIGQELIHNPNKEEAKMIIDTIYATPIAKQVISSYPFMRLPIRHALFYKCIATKCFWGARLLLWIKNHKK